MKRFFKWTALILVSLVVLALAIVGVFYLQLRSELNTTYDVDPAALVVPEPDSALLARGAHVAKLRDCTGCHTENLAGQVMVDDALMGTISSANLTSGPGGIGARYADEDWVRAIRHGVNPSGLPLMIMPVDQFAELGREDLQALIVYLKQVPPVEHTLPPQKVGLLLPVLVWYNDFTLTKAGEMDHDQEIPEAPVAGVTPDYGAYLSTSCQGCHKKNLAGGIDFGQQVANLTVLQDWSEADFFRAVREGLRPTGDTLSTGMPRWSALTDEEVAAIWSYLQTLDPLPMGDAP